MAGWEVKIIEAEARRLIPLAAEDAGLRALAEMILAATEDYPPRSRPDRGLPCRCQRSEPGRGGGFVSRTEQ